MKFAPILAAFLAATAIAPWSVAQSNPNASSPPLSEVESVPLVKDWTPAKFPTGVAKDIAAGTALIRITVDATGAISASRVLEATEPAFGEAALAAVKQWTFSPAMEKGKAIAMCLDVPIEFDRDEPTNKTLTPRPPPSPSPRTEATADDTPLGEYPESLHGRGLPGVIDFRCHVNADGTFSNFQITAASHADFVLPVIHAVPTWKFTPGKQGDLTVGSELVGEVTYRDADAPDREKILAMNGITGADGAAPDPAPTLVRIPDAVYPFDELLAGEGGSATVDFTVTANGEVRDAVVREATKPSFGASALAAVEACTFQGAVSRGVGQDVKLSRHVEFTPIAKDQKDSGEGLVHLVTLARAKGIGTSKGLDAKITPVYRMVPVKPGVLAEGEKGQAVVEFVIDRDGRGRIPRIVSASKPELGWAAATAVSQWVFNAPTRGGQPTEVRVQVPFAF